MIEQVEGEKPFSQKNLKYYIEKKTCFLRCGMDLVTHFLRIKNGEEKEFNWLGKPDRHAVTKQPS